jgi:Flp pilus assembly pilin Flp
MHGGDELPEGGVNGMLSIISAGVTYLRTRFAREEGAVATEYGLLLVLVALAIVLAATALGFALDAVFTEATGDLEGAG